MSNDATPTPPSVITKRAVKVIRQEREAHASLLAQFKAIRGEGASQDDVTSPLHRDLVWVTEAEQDFTHSMRTANIVLTLLVESMGDWVAGFSRLVEAEQPLPVQASACLRGLLESVLLGCYLLEPDLSTQQRLARFAACILNESQQAARIWEKVDFPPDVERDQWEWRDEEVQDQLTIGFIHKWSKDETKVESVWLGKERANLSINITEQATKFLPDNKEFYPLLSAHAHAQLWSSQGLRSADTEVTVGTATLQLLKLSVLWTQALCKYAGLDPQPMLAATERRHRAMTPRRFQYPQPQP